MFQSQNVRRWGGSSWREGGRLCSTRHKSSNVDYRTVTREPPKKILPEDHDGLLQAELELLERSITLQMKEVKFRENEITSMREEIQRKIDHHLAIRMELGWHPDSTYEPSNFRAESPLKIEGPSNNTDAHTSDARGDTDWVLHQGDQDSGENKHKNKNKPKHKHGKRSHRNTGRSTTYDLPYGREREGNFAGIQSMGMAHYGPEQYDNTSSADPQRHQQNSSDSDWYDSYVYDPHDCSDGPTGTAGHA